MRRVFLACGVAVFLAFGLSAKTIRVSLPGCVELELVEVSGGSELPLKFLYTGESRGEMSSVTAPTYWIGRFEITQKQYESVMRSNPSEIKDDRFPVTNVRWIEAIEFCDRLNRVSKGDLPHGYRFDLPTMVEWAHAFCCGETNAWKYAGSDDLDAVAWHGIAKEGSKVAYGEIHFGGLKRPNRIGAYDMSGNVGEHLFLAGTDRSSVRIGGSFLWPEKFCELAETSLVRKDDRAPDLGFRVVLVPVESRDPNGSSCAMATKGRILLETGHPEMARRYLGMAMSVNGLSAKEMAHVRETWTRADMACGYDVGSWPELVEDLSERLSGMGYRVKDILNFWLSDAATIQHRELRGIAEGMCRKSQIFGRNSCISDLHPSVVEKIGAMDMERKMQAISCDFTGDGIMDLVIEMPYGADDFGVPYAFFEHKKEGGYVLVGEPVRTVGMCVMPHERGGVAFLALIKIGDDVMEPGVLDCTTVTGRSCLRIAWPLSRSYALRELANGKIHPKLHFMGQMNEVRKANIASGKYLRPLCWPFSH